MYEDSKLSRKHIYTAYSYFKGAFGGMDHRILFKIMKELGFPDCYTQTCESLYWVSGTYYMTPHGNTPTTHTHTHRHTLRGHPITIPVHDIHGTVSKVDIHRK